jgi:hypothetical protein
MSLRAIAWQPRRLLIERDEVASSFLLAMTWFYITQFLLSVGLSSLCRLSLTWSWLSFASIADELLLA